MKLTTALLADAATVEGGKLFVHGGGWDKITLRQVPAVHPSMALVLVFQVEYDEALRDIPISIRLVDEDETASGAEINGVINVGHAPQSKRGAPTFVPQAITIQLIEFERTGRFSFKVSSGSEELGAVPFEVRQPDARVRPPTKEM